MWSAWWYSYLLFCSACLCAHVGIFLAHSRARPIVLVSLMDLINEDVARVYLAMNLLYAILNVPLLMEVTLPGIPALFLVNANIYLFFCLLLYLTVGVVARYLHVQLTQVNLFEEHSDFTVRNFLRVAVGAAGLALITLNQTYNIPSSLYYDLAGEAFPVNESNASFNAIGTVGLVSVVVNAVLRCNIHCKRGKDDVAGGRPHLAYMASSALMTVPILASIVVSKLLPDVIQMYRLFGVGYTCVALPTAALIPNRRLRAFASKEVWGGFRRIGERIHSLRKNNDLIYPIV